MAAIDPRLATARHLQLGASVEAQIERRLRDLLVPALGDALRVSGENDADRENAGVGVPPDHLAGEAGRDRNRIARPPDRLWEAVDPGSTEGRVYATRLAAPLTRLIPTRWLLLERKDGRSPLTADDLHFIEDVATLANFAIAGAASSQGLREARTAADEAAHRWSTLARLSERVARSPDLDHTLSSALDAIVPYVADWAILDVLDAGGRLERRACRHIDEERGEALDALRCFPYGPSGAESEAATGPDRLLSDVTAEELEGLASPAELEALAIVGVTSLVRVPLRAASRLLGVLTIGSGSSGQRYAEDDAVLFRSMAHQAALALSTAQQYGAAEQARRAREEVLAIVSHDLKNPLNTIGFAATILGMSDLPEERRAGNIEVIRRSVAQMNELIGNLLDAGAIESGRLQITPAVVDVDELLKDALRRHVLQAERAGIGLEAGEPTGLKVGGDRARLLQVLGNLIDNAVSLSPSGTTVRLDASADGEIACITVRDEGPGVEPAVVPHIFDRFWQARRSGKAGTGLGLSIARGIVRAHGGEIGVEPAPGGGSIFHFTVPLARPAEAQS